MENKEAIQALKEGERYIVPEGDYGRAEIWRINDYYIMFSIPLYGGEPSFHGHYRLVNIDKMIEIYESWT